MRKKEIRKKKKTTKIASGRIILGVKTKIKRRKVGKRRGHVERESA